MSATDQGETLIRVCCFTISQNVKCGTKLAFCWKKKWSSRIKVRGHEGKKFEIVSHLVVLRDCVMHNFPFLAWTLSDTWSTEILTPYGALLLSWHWPSPSTVKFPEYRAWSGSLETVTRLVTPGYPGWSEVCTLGTLSGAGAAGWESQLTPQPIRLSHYLRVRFGGVSISDCKYYLKMCANSWPPCPPAPAFKLRISKHTY